MYYRTTLSIISLAVGLYVSLPTLGAASGNLTPPSLNDETEHKQKLLCIDIRNRVRAIYSRHHFYEPATEIELFYRHLYYTLQHLPTEVQKTLYNYAFKEALLVHQLNLALAVAHVGDIDVNTVEKTDTCPLLVLAEYQELQKDCSESTQLCTLLLNKAKQSTLTQAIDHFLKEPHLRLNSDWLIQLLDKRNDQYNLNEALFYRSQRFPLSVKQQLIACQIDRLQKRMDKRCAAPAIESPLSPQSVEDPQNNMLLLFSPGTTWITPAAN